MTQLIQRFLSVPEAMLVSGEAVKMVEQELKLPGRHLVVVSIMEPELYSTPSDWQRVVLEYERQRVEFLNLVLRETPKFMQRLVVYLNCLPEDNWKPSNMADNRVQPAYARVSRPPHRVEWKPELYGTPAWRDEDGERSMLTSGSIGELFMELSFKTEEVRFPEPEVSRYTIDLRKTFQLQMLFPTP